MNTNKTVLHHYLPEKLQVVLTHDLTDDYSWQDWTESVNEDSFKQGAIWTLSGFTDPKLNISAGEGELSEYILQREDRTWISVDSKSFKPALHSMNRLTMPLENGEIPILQLAKIGYEGYDSQVWELDVDNYCVSGSLVFAYDEKGFNVACYYNGSQPVKNQLQLFQYLINNHFNCFGLSESEYIEKSTLKI